METDVNSSAALFSGGKSLLKCRFFIPKTTFFTTLGRESLKVSFFHFKNDVSYDFSGGARTSSTKRSEPRTSSKGHIQLIPHKHIDILGK